MPIQKSPTRQSSPSHHLSQARAYTINRLSPQPQQSPMSAYRVCPGCGYDSCICPEASYDHGQPRPLKIKLSTTKSPSRPAAAYTGPAAAGISKQQAKKRGPPPKPGRFTLPHSQAHVSYDQRARQSSAKIKKFNPAKTFKNGATRRASAQRKGGRGSYRPTDDDLYGSDHFPTFVSAESSSSDDEDDDEEDTPPAQCVAEVTDVTSPAEKGRVPAAQGEEESSDDGSDESSELTDPDDISVQLSEERFIIAEERARVKRELLGNDDTTGGSYKKRFDWQASPSKRSSQTSSGSLTDSDSGSESSSEDELEQTAEGDDEEPAEDDADVTMRAASTPLPERDDSSSEEDDFDAAVFFASLDSENEDGHESDVDDDTTSIASELDQPPPAENDFHIPIVSQDMHGLLVFGDPLAMNDVGIDIPGFPSSTSLSASTPTAHEGEATDSDDGYMMDVDTDQGATEDEDDDASTLGMESDDGETTDDMDEDELVQILAPRFSTPPPQSVDPLALICPPASAMPVSTPFTSNATPAPRQRNTFRRRRDTTMSAPSFSSGSSLSPPPAIVRGPKLPTMGRFENPSVASPSSPADPTVKVVVIDGTTKNIPSPFTRRLRRDLLHLRAKRLSKRRYLSTSPLMSAGENSDNSLPSFAGTSSQTFIDLSDVLDCAIFEDEEEELEESIIPESPAIPEPPISPSESDAPGPSGSLTRWDRVPMNTFRRTRSDAVMDLGSPFDMNLPLPGLPLSPTFAYNKVLKSPGAHSAKWWDPKSTLATPTSRRDKRRHPSASIQAVLALSPMLFPSDYGGGNGSSSPPRGSQYHSSPHKIHRDKERRARKTKTVDSAAVKPQKRQSHIQRRSSLQAVPSLRL